MSGTIAVEVIYALPERVERVSLTLNEGATVAEAIAASRLQDRYPDIDPNGNNKIGIIAKLAKSDTVLRDQDRVEIYRPLIADPKAVRKKRADEGKVMKKGGGSAEDAQSA